MRLFNQGKYPLKWTMSGQAFECEPWGLVDVPDELVGSVKSRGLPLDITPVPHEQRAQARIADDQAAASDSALRAIHEKARRAEAAERIAKEELGACQGEVSRLNKELREAYQANEKLNDDVARLKADKKAAEDLLSEEARKATEAEERAIRAEALHAEKSKEKPAKKPG